jgi:hypothetical protein
MSKRASRTGRSADELLAELGSALDRAFALRHKRSSLLRTFRIVGTVTLAAGVGAAGTVVLAGAGASAPIQTLPVVAGLVEQGTTAGVRWELAVEPCLWIPGSFTVSLVTAHGEMIAGCDGQARPVTTYHDVAAGVALVFGTVPGGTTSADIAASGGGQRRVTALTEATDFSVAKYTGNAGFFVSAVPAAQVATAITVYSGAQLLEACNELACAAPRRGGVGWSQSDG